MNILVDSNFSIEVPRKAIARDGQQWDPRSDLWCISNLSVARWFNFTSLKTIISDELIAHLKLTMIHYLNSYSVDHASNCFTRFCSLLKYICQKEDKPIEIIKLESIIAYRMTLDRRKEWYLGVLRGFFDNWIQLGFPGVEPSAVDWLNNTQLKGNIKGEAIRTLNPESGSFSDIEYQGLITALNNQFAKGGIDLEDYILVWLFLALGSRAVQFAALKIQDFRKVEVPGGACTYLLQIPRAKQRGRSPRSEFKVRKLVPDIGILLENFAQSLREKWGHVVADAGELPLFFNPSSGIRIHGFEHHCTSVDLSRRLDAIFDMLAVRSERTNEPLKITTRRFRYTRGTRAAAEGASELVIAELLDHSDTQNVGVYVETVPEILERIDKAMAIYLAPMAQAFAGQLIDGESEAKRGGDPRSRIVGPEAPDRPVGSCGSLGFCAAAAPIACYTCRSFQPWRDGPHLDILKFLIADRDRVLAETGDVTIASVNDRTILACAEVVRMCLGITGSQVEE